MDSPVRKIEIGPGRNPRPGYESCDIRDLPGVDHVCAANKLPFADGSIDEIYSRHLIEHLTLKQCIETLVEWNRALKVGGVLYIATPNLLWHAQQLLEGTHGSLYTKERERNDRYWAFGSLFGWQQDEHDIHKFGYYFELLRDMLEDAGFDAIEDKTNQADSTEHAVHHLEVRAVKSRDVSDPHSFRLYDHFDVRH